MTNEELVRAKRYIQMYHERCTKAGIGDWWFVCNGAWTPWVGQAALRLAKPDAPDISMDELCGCEP